MTIRIPLAVVWTTAILLLVGGAAVAGAAAHRFGPYATLEATVSQTKATVLSLERRVEQAKAIIEDKDNRLSEAHNQLESQKNETQVLQSELSQIRTSLGSTQSRLQQKQRQAQRQFTFILSQERDIYVLRTCLRGVAGAMRYLVEEDYDSTIDSLRSVERECRAASKLM